MKTIKHDLILTKDTIFKESITVEGDIKGDFNLKVVGNIDAMDINVGNIDAMDIDAWNINAWNINAMDINAWNIDVRNIDAGDIKARDIDARNIDAGDIKAGDIDVRNIICEKRIKKTKLSKTICRIFIENRSKLERKERG